jgi:hypothetical protein
MPYLPSFSVSQTPSNPAYVLITDTSAGSDLGIAFRRIVIKDCNGNYIVPQGTTTDYINWELNENPISLDILKQDTAVNIQVLWYDADSQILYDVNNNFCLSQYNKQFLYYLIQLQSLNYNIIQDNNYWGNVGILWTNITGAINSVEIGNDIFASQTCLNRATFMAQNQDIYF